MPFELMDEDVEMSIYALTRRQRQLLWVALLTSLGATVTLAICDAVFTVRLTVPALIAMSVANLCAISLLFAKRLVPVHAAFRYGYKSGRLDERIGWAGDR
jgi:uncharacterized membrane protein